jgi:hypothetical protein
MLLALRSANIPPDPKNSLKVRYLVW